MIGELELAHDPGFRSISAAKAYIGFKLHHLVVESSHGETVPDETLDCVDKVNYKE